MRRLAILLVGLLVAARGWAGGTIPCSQAMVFEDAAVNVLVLPYRYDAPDRAPHPELAGTGEQLAALAQLEILFSMLKYQSVAAVRLAADAGPCDPDRVIERVTHGDAYALKAGHGLVVLWGRTYVEGEQIYLQSYLRFLRRDADETVTVEVPAGDGTIKLLARLPAQGLALAPRAISRSDLQHIEAAVRESLVVRPTPEDAARGTPLDIHPGAPFTYGVDNARGDWMHIVSRTGGPSGWVHVRADTDTWALRRFLPELGYVDGLAGYLRLAASGLPVAEPARTFGWVTRDFDAYEHAAGADAAPLALALSRSLRGFLLWNRAVSGEAAPLARRRAAGLFAEALAYAPHYAQARNLAAITAPYLAEGGPRPDPGAARALDDGLLGALAVDARDPIVLGNLETVYAEARQRRIDLYPDLDERLQLIRALRTAR